MNRPLTLEDRVAYGRGRHKKVADIVSDKKVIFELIKAGKVFSNEVLEAAHIKKTIRDVKCSDEIVTHAKKDTTVLPKDRKSVENICKELFTLDNLGEENISDDSFNTEEDDNIEEEPLEDF